MRNQKHCLILMPLFFAAMSSACSTPDMKSADVRSDIRASLDKADLEAVSIDQDRDKGILTLRGRVPTEGEKIQAATIANSWAGGQVVANQIEVISLGDDAGSRAANSDLDKGIKNSLDVALVQKGLDDDVHFEVKNAVVTLRGSVNSATIRWNAEKTAAKIPNVQQVVNELQLKNQKDTTR